jgi:cupin fold WbuC family metalloprotein
VSNRIPPAGGDGQAFRPLDQRLVSQAAQAAQASPRRRALLRYHELPENVQRMINALEPDSYVCPHVHDAPPKVEVFLALQGRGLLVRFDERGEILGSVEIAAGGPTFGVEIPPGTWHTALALEPGSVFYEVKDGPYDPATDKHFASWAPPEGDPAALTYLDRLRTRLGLPALADLLAEADEDDFC